MCIHCNTGEDGDCQCDEISRLKDEIARLKDEIEQLREERRWIPVTEQLPPEDGTDVDFLSVGGYDGYGHRNTRVDQNVMFEYEAGPYQIGKDSHGYWGVTHWRLRPGQQPDFDKFFEDNE